MEQRKSDINTDDGNVVNINSNGLNYSFDFSSQVDSTSNVAKPSSVETLDVIAPAAEPVQPVAPMPAVEPVQPAAPMSAAEPVQPAAPMPAVEPVQPVAPMPAAEPVQPAAPMPAVEPVQPVAPMPAAEPVQPVAPMPAAEPVQPVAPMPAEQVQQSVQTDGDDLIKDKKSTKTFLIILGIVVAIFIIALPFIFRFFG